MHDDPFKILEVSYDANGQDIVSAFRRLVKLYHPDVNQSPEAPERFRQVYAAYRLLSNSQSRKEQRDQWAPQTERNNKRTSRSDQASSSASTSERSNTSYSNETGAYFGGRPKNSSSSSQSEASKSNQTTSGTRVGKRRSQSSAGHTAKEVDHEPSPVTFGLHPNYYDNLLLGVKLWKDLEPVPTKHFQYFTAVALIGSLAVIPALWEYLFVWAGVGLLVLFYGYEQYNDNRREQYLKNYLVPRFHPNPKGWEDYLIAFNKYHKQNMPVFITKTGKCYHQNKLCMSSIYVEQMPLKDAELAGLTPCSKCTWHIKSHLQTPHPFSRNDIYA